MSADPSGLGASLSDRGMSGSLEPNRYHALDRARALAMLLGVVYYTLLFRMFTGGGPPGAMMGQLTASKLLGDWLHSFRMPLFFLIAGFFGRMMLAKYGTAGFLRRRWRRIGLPLMIGLVTFGPIYVLTQNLVMRPPSFGPGGPGGPGGMRPPGAMTPRPGGREVGPSAMTGPGGPGAFAPGPPSGPGGPRFGPPGGGGGPPFGPPGGGIAGRFLGPSARLFQLNHLWFLWYLLVFITVAPFLAWGIARAVPPSTGDSGDRLGLRLVRFGLGPVLLAIASAPALLATQSPFDWFLGLAPAIFRAFPDFLLHYDVDMLFYFAYFAAGWWLHREREALPSLAGAWLANSVVGLVAFGVAIGLQTRSGAGPFSPVDPGIDRVVAVGFYCLGSACTSFAFLGVFLRFLDFPSRTWRYLADSALWVYLIHQPLVLLGLAACRPLGLPWWALTAIVSASSIAVSLVLYEWLVRRTALASILGPSADRSRSGRDPGLMATPLTRSASGSSRPARS